jgi:hypothetical protein
METLEKLESNQSDGVVVVRPASETLKLDCDFHAAT